LCYGTDEADTLYGSPGEDWMWGHDGGDTMHGYRNQDRIFGDAGPDKIYGGRESDGLFAGAPTSDVLEAASNDYVHGGRGGDGIARTFEQEGGVDRLYGEKGNDYIRTAQRYRNEDWPPAPVLKEIVGCGPGTDTVTFDKGVDVVKANCEIKYRHYVGV
jgi:Ca2+-binding RTX toxin-like protein